MAAVPPAPAHEGQTLAIGLISGTSADGIDAALVAINEVAGAERLASNTRLLAFRSEPYPAEVREELFSLFRQEPGAVARLCHLNFVIGELFAEAALAVARDSGVAIEEVAFIASHGQTVWHQPESRALGGRTTRATLQIGEPCVIAERTGTTVVADFRPRDIAAGGEGAPFAPYMDALFLRSPDSARAVQNLGGIGNVTYLPAGQGTEGVIAFDTGPGNMAIDAAAARVTGGAQVQDTGGGIARTGRVDPALLAELLADPFLSQPPPKSTGRERYGEPFVAALWERGYQGRDLVATLTAFTAASVADAYTRFLLPRGPIDVVILGGGGVHNPVLVEELRRRLSPAKIQTHADFGIPDDAKEAIAFALIGHATLRGLPANLPSVTGATRPVVLGKVVPCGRTG
jgi:anhydro-N-acetylmuramic acid kinase